MFHKFLTLPTLLDMVLTSARIEEYIELEPSAAYAIYSRHPSAFEYTVHVKQPNIRGLQTLALEFTPNIALLCSAEVFRALRNADILLGRLAFIDIQSGGEIFAPKPAKLEKFAPNPPTLKEAFDTLDKLPAQKGNFGDTKGVLKPVKFAPNEPGKKHPGPKKAAPKKVSGFSAQLSKTAAFAPGPKAIAPAGKAQFDFLNKGCWTEDQTAGFWRERGERTEKDHLPFPVIGVCAGYQRAEFLFFLDRVQSRLKPKVFRGMSPHRWTGEFNGSAEYQVDGWKWPEGYRTYIQAGVLPSREFHHFITGRHVKGLPSFAKLD